MVGSSPRARGTVNNGIGGAVIHRFIPACAGNRSWVVIGAIIQTVHPRVRGEQVLLPSKEVGGYGSSPRARGTVAGQ